MVKSEIPPRQRQVLTLLADGKSSAEIAFDLELSKRTIDEYRESLMLRLGARNAPHLVALAFREGLLRA